MPLNYLVLALLSGTFGFALWYVVSSSLRLPASFQVQFDINTSYFNRILRRRLAGFLIFGLIPFLLIFPFDLLGDVSLEQLGLSFEWNRSVGLWLLALLPVGILASWLIRNDRSNQEIFPEIRVAIWTPKLLLLSAFFWIIYVISVEFLYRGLVLQSLLMNTGNRWMAVLGSTGLYVMIHYFRDNRISWISLLFGLVGAWMTLACGSLLPAVLLHLVTSLTTEWFSIYSHPEMRMQRRLYD